MAEATALKAVCCGFESHSGYALIAQMVERLIRMNSKSGRKRSMRVRIPLRARLYVKERVNRVAENAATYL